MKQYFAKYLPVEGEIKKGDYVKCNGAQGIVTDTWGSITVLEKDGEEHNWRSDIPKLHKLFLCSRDIQDNEEFYFSPNPIYYSDKKQTMRKLERKLLAENSVLPKFVYKVIGEISPEAVWVKEGDEFDIEDVIITQYKKHPELNTVKVECPNCNHFH